MTTALTPTKTCERCGGRSERVTTLPKSPAAPGYDVYECLECNDIEWVPQGLASRVSSHNSFFPLDLGQRERN
jgi:hypothetical protein